MARRCSTCSRQRRSPERPAQGRPDRVGGSGGSRNCGRRRRAAFWFSSRGGFDLGDTGWTTPIDPPLVQWLQVPGPHRLAGVVGIVVTQLPRKRLIAFGVLALVTWVGLVAPWLFGGHPFRVLHPFMYPTYEWRLPSDFSFEEWAPGDLLCWDRVSSGPGGPSASTRSLCGGMSATSSVSRLLLVWTAMWLADRPTSRRRSAVDRRHDRRRVLRRATASPRARTGDHTRLVVGERPFRRLGTDDRRLPAGVGDAVRRRKVRAGIPSRSDRRRRAEPRRRFVGVRRRRPPRCSPLRPSPHLPAAACSPVPRSALRCWPSAGSASAADRVGGVVARGVG